MIIGNDLLESLKIDLKYSTATIEWDGAEIPMKSRDATPENSYFVLDSPCIEEATNRTSGKEPFPKYTFLNL